MPNYSGPSELVHLHCHTAMSALDGVAVADQYAKECSDRGYPAMAITEHGHMASVPDAYMAFKEHGVKYIPACEIYYNDYEPVRQELESKGIKVRSTKWRAENTELYQRIARNRHLTVLCKNETGYHNLIKLTTQSYETGLFGAGSTQFNRIWFDKLCEFKEGLIILSGCLNGPANFELRTMAFTDRDGNVIRDRNDRERVEETVKYLKKFKSVFGDDFYVELQMPGVEGDDCNLSDVDVFRSMVSIADHLKLKVVVTNDCHYLRRNDFILQKIMMAVSQGMTVDSPDLFHVNSNEQFMKSREELYDRFIEYGYSEGLDNGVFESMCDNTLEVADKCVELELDSMPKIPDIEDAETKLCRIVAEELHRRGLHKVKKKYFIDGNEVTYLDQAKIELKRFIDKGYASYFLITHDLISYGRRNGWPFSPRGSAGGSLVCFLLGIHTIDPLKWGLSFDRFLSPSRGGYMLDVSIPPPIE